MANRLLNALLSKPWEESRKLPVNGRLAWYTGPPSQHLWTEHWGGVDLASPLTDARRSRYPHRLLLRRLLPANGRVIEAGCGPAHIVLGLQRDGYQAIGIEWSEEVVRRVKVLAPECRIQQGDVRRLDFPDGYANGYISLGVVEHFPEGPEAILTEARRVLADGGWLILSVPHFNPWRQWKARHELYEPPAVPPDPAHFYQYAFRAEEMTKTLEGLGFEVVDTDGLGVLFGFGREFGRSVLITCRSRRISI